MTDKPKEKMNRTCTVVQKMNLVAPYISFFCNMIRSTLWPVRELLCKHQVIYKIVMMNFLSPENYSEARWHPQVQNGDITLTHQHSITHVITMFQFRTDKDKYHFAIF